MGWFQYHAGISNGGISNRGISNKGIFKGSHSCWARLDERDCTNDRYLGALQRDIGQQFVSRSVCCVRFIQDDGPFGSPQFQYGNYNSLKRRDCTVQDDYGVYPLAVIIAPDSIVYAVNLKPVGFPANKLNALLAGSFAQQLPVGIPHIGIMQSYDVVHVLDCTRYK